MTRHDSLVRRLAPEEPTAQAWEERDPARIEEAAALFGWPEDMRLSTPRGMLHVGWLWAYPSGSYDVTKIGGRWSAFSDMPIDVRPVFAPTDDDPDSREVADWRLINRHQTPQETP